MKPEFRTGPGNREQRFLPTSGTAEVRAAGADGAATIEGYGALFNSETVIYGYFRERIAPGAFTESIAQDDIRVAFNHSPMCILGRTSAKTATVEEDSTGLKYTATPPDTMAGRDTVTSIKRGDITGSSFQFEIEDPDGEEWDYSETKKGMLPLRTIKKARLFELGPVAFPAYENTTVSARAMGKVEEARELREAADRATADAAATTCPACSGSGLNPERQMSDPKGQSPCDRCKGSGKREAKAEAAPQPAAAETGPPAEMPLSVLDAGLDLDLMEID